jgi:hypothetical protein
MTAPLTKYYRRKAAAKFIKEKYQQSVSESLLAKLACKGGGPLFRKIQGDAIYEEEDLDAYALSRIGPKVASTAELTVGRSKSTGRPPAKKVERRTSVEAA